MGITPLIYAARYGDFKICSLLISNGANLNAIDSKGDTALIASIIFKNECVAKLLIDSGIDVTVKNKDQLSALDLAHKLKFGEIASKIRKVLQ